MRLIKLEWVMLAGITLGTWFATYMRIQTTLIGYRIGELKNLESHELERLSRLKMKLAKLTSLENLTILSSGQQGRNHQLDTVAAIERLK